MLKNVGTAVVRRTTGLARRTVVSRTSPALAGVDKPDIDFVSVDGMERKYSKTPYHLRKAIRVKATGKSLLSSPAFNKGASFSLGERDRLQLRGLLPPRKVTMKQQVERTEQQLAQEDSMIRKNRYMRDLLDTNETLSHRVLLDNIKEPAPVLSPPHRPTSIPHPTPMALAELGAWLNRYRWRP